MRIAVFIVVLVLAAGCQSGAALGTSCASSSACGSPLVCRLGRCRNECAQNRDCPIGTQCYLDGAGLGACELDVDRSCGAESCGVGLTCLASECVRACSLPSDCPSDGQCTIASGATVGVCSDTRSQADAGIGDGGALEAGDVDASSGCPALDAVRVCTGVGFSCAIRTDASVVCWGVGDAGQLGTLAPATLCDGPGGPTPCSMRPVTVPLEETGALGGAVDIGCGEDFACVRRMDGHVRCWGRNYDGMLGAPGDGLFGARRVVDGAGIELGGVTALAVGAGFACAQRGPSSVHCWGANVASQLGQGGPTSTGQSPAPSPELTTAGSIAGLFAMSESTCIAHSGTAAMELHCLGQNGRAELGVAPSSLASSPTLRLLDLVALDPTHPIVSAGDSFACAIGPDGHVQCWGWNDQGSLGRFAPGTTFEPMPAGLYGQASTRTFSTLFGGAVGLTTCGVTTEGLYCWGSNGAGQAGQDPAISDSARAALVPGLPPIETGSCGQQGCCAVDASHTLWCWGANAWAQLGRGTTSPVEFVPAHVCAP